VYFGGDSGWFPEYGRIGEQAGPFDLTLLPIGAYEPRWFMKSSHMNPEDAVQAFLRTKIRWSPPIGCGGSGAKQDCRKAGSGLRGSANRGESGRQETATSVRASRLAARRDSISSNSRCSSNVRCSGSYPSRLIRVRRERGDSTESSSLKTSPYDRRDARFMAAACAPSRCRP
jgi:hypothetical protein